MILTNPQKSSLKQAAMPLIKWLNDNCHPHVSVIVTPTSAEMLEGICLIRDVFDYVKDKVIIYEPQPNDMLPYFKCPKCGGENITRAFNRCIDCGTRIIWKKRNCSDYCRGISRGK